MRRAARARRTERPTRRNDPVVERMSMAARLKAASKDTRRTWTPRLLGATVLALCAALALTAGATAAGRAETKVTIKANGLDLFGFVKSEKPKRCADGRKVLVIKQKGKRGGDDDEKFASDTAGLSGDRYRWETGNTGTPGRFYSKVRRTEKCKGDTSKTIRAEQE
jgi:hypothetical protein